MAPLAPPKFELTEAQEFELSVVNLHDAIATLYTHAKRHLALADKKRIDDVTTQFARDVLQHLPVMHKKDNTMSTKNTRIRRARNEIEKNLLPGALRREQLFSVPPAQSVTAMRAPMFALPGIPSALGGPRRLEHAKLMGGTMAVTPQQQPWMARSTATGPVALDATYGLLRQQALMGMVPSNPQSVVNPGVAGWAISATRAPLRPIHHRRSINDHTLPAGVVLANMQSQLPTAGSTAAFSAPAFRPLQGMLTQQQFNACQKARARPPSGGHKRKRSRENGDRGGDEQPPAQRRRKGVTRTGAFRVED